MRKGVLITGASDRIGKALALFFAEEGYNVAIHYASSKEKAEITANEIMTKTGNRYELFQADFKQEEQVSGLIQQINKKFTLNCLINNASDFYENSFNDEGTSDLDHFFKVNFKAPYILSKEFARTVPINSLIINILDTNIKKNSTKHFDYLLSKKFLEIFTQQAAFYLAPKIRVNGIAPGIILPPPGKDEEYIIRTAQNIPLKQRGFPQNVITATEYLLKNEFVTGDILFVDGGESL